MTSFSLIKIIADGIRKNNDNSKQKKKDLRIFGVARCVVVTVVDAEVVNGLLVVDDVVVGVGACPEI